MGKSFKNGKLNIDNQIDGKVKIDSKVNGGVGIIPGGSGGRGTQYHDKLEHREYPDQHPIEAITGLETVLSEKVNNNELATVAFSGLLNDLSSDGFTVLYCGTSTEVI